MLNHYKYKCSFVFEINLWVFALSEEIKRRNPSAFVITPGKMLWRKLKIILHWYFVDRKKQKVKVGNR